MNRYFQMLIHIKKNQGIGLLELFLALLIITSLTIVSLRYYFTARESSRVTQAATMINTITKAMYQWYAHNSDLAAFKASDLKPYLPGNYTSQAGSPNPWSPPSEPGFSLEVDPTSKTFKITLQHTPEAACIRLQGQLAAYTKTRPKCGEPPHNRNTLTLTFELANET